jgi:hypothetical protein
MSRRTPAILAIGALTAMTVLVAASADAAPTQHRSISRDGHHPSVSIQSGVARAADSVALVGADDGSFQAAKGVAGLRPHKSGLFDLDDTSFATAVNPVRGKDGLLCTGSAAIQPVKGLRATPHVSSSIDGSAYSDEGGSAFDYLCYGVAVRGSFALATGDSQGLLQLIRHNGVWKVDTRVQSPGLNDAGQPTSPGGSTSVTPPRLPRSSTPWSSRRSRWPTAGTSESRSTERTRQ